MATFGKRSRNNLAQCHQDLQVLFNEVIQYTDCAVICGHRGEKAQNEAYDNGFSQLKFPQSKHNSKPSMAADVVPWPIDWGNIKRFIDFGNFVLHIAMSLYKDGKISHKVVWGGCWASFPDYPHFELR